MYWIDVATSGTETCNQDFVKSFLDRDATLGNRSTRWTVILSKSLARLRRFSNVLSFEVLADSDTL